MTAITAANVFNSHCVGSAGSVHDQSSSRGFSLSRLGKTVGLLGLALFGGAQSAQAFKGDRRLMDASIEPKPIPYDYDSVCDDGLSTPYVQGTNYEACMAAENAQIDAIRQNKDERLGQTKRCYTISGYSAAALFGNSVLGTGAALLLSSQTASELLLRSVSSTFCLGIVALVPTTVCGAIHSNIKVRLEDSREKAKECCKVFPTQEELEKFAAASAEKKFADALTPVSTNTTR